MADRKDPPDRSPDFDDRSTVPGDIAHQVTLTEQVLASDAEYLLLSAKIDVDQISEALVDEYYPFLYQLAADSLREDWTAHNKSTISLVDSPELDPPDLERMVDDLVCSSLAYAVSHTHEYRKRSADDQNDVRAWLESILKRQSNASGELLSSKKRIAKPTRQDREGTRSGESVKQRVSVQAQSRLRRQNRETNLKTAFLVVFLFVAVAWLYQTLGNFQTDRLVQVDAQITDPAPEVISGLLAPPPSPTPLWQENVLYSSLIPESVGEIAERFDLSESTLRQLNQFDGVHQEFPDTPLYLPVPEIFYPPNMPHPQLFRQSLPALDGSSTPQAIAERLAISHRLWRTLYMDVQLLNLTRDSGNNQYVPGRSQVWVVQPDRSLEISGYSPGLAGERSIILKGRHYFTAAGYEQPVQTVGLPEQDMLVFNPLLREMAFPMNALLKIDPGKYLNLGIQAMAGNEALAVDWYNARGELEYHLWIEPQTGLLLRLQQIDPYTGILLNDRLVTQFEVNFEPPPSDFFDPRRPWSETYAQDQTGRPGLEQGFQPTPTFAFP
jgi:hypothetical protein